MPSTTDEQLRHYTDTYWGYGSLDAPYWFVGPEEGGGRSWQAIQEHLQAWVDSGALPMVPLDTQGRSSPYWRQVSRLYLAAAGQPCDAGSVKRYVAEELARPDSDTCLLELLPLPSRATGEWLYGSHSDLPELRDRATYRSALLSGRVPALRSLIEHHKPKYVVFLGRTDAAHWRDIAGIDLPMRPEAPVASPVTGGRMTVSCHPASRGVTNAYFKDLGRALAGPVL